MPRRRASSQATDSSLTESRPDAERLKRATADEVERFVALHPRSGAAAEDAGALFGGVPMPWMRRWPGPFPIVAASAVGARVVDIDGLEYADLCLGDTGAMTGHAPPPVVAAVAEQAARGITTMLPHADAAVVADLLRERFGLPHWQFTLSATDANRTAIRFARHLTGRPRILVFDGCYHGSVDETFAVLGEGGAVIEREGGVGAPVDVAETTRVVPFNDPEALEAALAHGDVAAVLAEPALTNMGIVLAQPGFHAALRQLTRAAGALLIIDETHTLSAGHGGCTARDGLEPDLLTVGKAIAGGVPLGALGMTAPIAAALLADERADLEDTGGIGGTLAGNALSLAAARAALSDVLTPDAHADMEGLAERFADGVESALAAAGVPWQVTRLGARAEYSFTDRPLVTADDSRAGMDRALEVFLHLFCLNRGVLITPFHNMALMCPQTTAADVDRHTAVFAEALTALYG